MDDEMPKMISIMLCYCKSDQIFMSGMVDGRYDCMHERIKSYMSSGGRCLMSAGSQS